MDSVIEGRLLVHVAFHYNPKRIKYLTKVLSALSAYRFSTVDIVVDTNSEISKQVCIKIDPEITCLVYDNLDHPFHLTWVHRDHMAARLNEYDFFMYVEDDIYIPWKAVVEWHRNTLRLRESGFLCGFLRIEKTPVRQRPVASDFVCSEHYEMIDVGGKKYINPSYPYSACWLYSQRQMLEFVDTAAWTTDFSSLDYIREKAAVGMTHMNVPEGYKNRIVLPLNDKLKISEQVYVFHLPNNYAKSRFFQEMKNKILFGNTKMAPYGYIHPDDIIINSSGGNDVCC